MLMPCKDCGQEARHIPRRTTLCLPCKAARQRTYCRKTDYHRKRYARIAGGERERHLVRKYGVTQVGYDRMLAAQGGVCAICERAQERALNVDHCHATGKVRGLLCTNCNRMVGHAADDPARLEAAASYLRAIVPQVAAEFVQAFLEAAP
jgi:hypothetical protein